MTPRTSKQAKKPHFYFIVGGTRSGKSKFACHLAKEIGNKILFVATCAPTDSEMKRRVTLHKKSRPKNWATIENNHDVKKIIKYSQKKYDTIIVDCLGLLISTFMSKGLKDSKILNEIKSVAKEVSKRKSNVIVVSNEVGEALIPQNKAARQFTDLMGFSNQIMAKNADFVYSVKAGIPVRMK